MILYFSATGNNKYVAENIADALCDTAVSIEKFSDREIRLHDGESLGIVTPTYFFELPSVMKEFLEAVTIIPAENNYVFGVVTYGSTSGCCGIHLKKALQKKGIETDVLFSVLTPDTWTIVYDLSDPDAVRKTLGRTETQLSTTINRLKTKQRGDFRDRRLPYFLTAIYDPLYQRARNTSHFTVDDTCIGCGLCEKNCPVKAIQMKDEKPAWVKEKCAICLRCLHSCPKFAIQYGEKTSRHGQYRKEKY